MGNIHDFDESVDPSLKDFKPEYKKLELREVPDIDLAKLYRRNEIEFDGDVLECKSLEDLHRILKESGVISDRIKDVYLYGKESSR